MSGVKRFEAHYLTEGVMGGKGLARAEMILASDYDRDTQALKDERDSAWRHAGMNLENLGVALAERDTFKAECVNLNNILDQIRIERDALRAQVEAMRELLSGVCDYADDLLTDVNRAWSYCGSTGADEVHKDADYLAARAALQEDKPC